MTTDFGQIIERERERRGKTITWLANEAGISVGHMSKIESGDRVPSLDLLEKLLRILNLEMILRNERVGVE